MAGKHESLVRGRIRRRPPRRVTIVRAISLIVALIAGAVIALAAPSWAAGPPAPTGTPVPGTPCTASASACVDLTSLQAWLIKNGQVVYGPVPISTGIDADPSKRTPAGNHKVLWKAKDHISTESKTPQYPNGVPMPYSVFFTNTGVAFHEGDLGAESLGCVHLQHDAAVTFFNTLQVGQQVQVRNPV
jgi:lipoprotein-anchoring transpeptidase ErfK/SrfK